ncbi:MAG: hypothetical protein NC419_01780 [Muribaculaceae bacterium]|nr:hypothetical protein [Muribaculaceae bacterium]
MSKNKSYFSKYHVVDLESKSRAEESLRPDDCFYGLEVIWNTEAPDRERNAMNTHEEGFNHNNHQWFPAAV